MSPPRHLSPWPIRNRGTNVQGDTCPGGTLVWGDSCLAGQLSGGTVVQGGNCPGGLMSGGQMLGGHLSGGQMSQHRLSPPHCVKCLPPFLCVEKFVPPPSLCEMSSPLPWWKIFVPVLAYKMSDPPFVFVYGKCLSQRYKQKSETHKQTNDGHTNKYTDRYIDGHMDGHTDRHADIPLYKYR